MDAAFRADTDSEVMDMKHADNQTNADRRRKSPDRRDPDPYRVEATSDFPVCSASECTGLIPALPLNEDQREFYEELYPYLADARQQP